MKETKKSLPPKHSCLVTDPQDRMGLPSAPSKEREEEEETEGAL